MFTKKLLITHIRNFVQVDFCKSRKRHISVVYIAYLVHEKVFDLSVMKDTAKVRLCIDEREVLGSA